MTLIPHLDRRDFLTLSGGAALAGLLSACSGFTTSSGDQQSAPSGSSGTGGATGTLTFTTWGTDAELAGFRAAIASFEQANSGVTVELNAVPYEQMFTGIDAQLQAGTPPDVFRVPYYTFGAYAGRGQLLDLTSHLPSDFSSRFTPQAWAAVQNGGKPFGVPHHTDTSVIFFNKKLLADAGVTAPTTVDEAWTWDQLLEAGEKLKKTLPDSARPFAYNWQGNGVTRWLSLLFQADGRFLTEKLDAAAIDSDAGRKAVEFSKSFFTQNLVPANDSINSTTYASASWYAQSVAMVWGGAFMIPDADSTADFEWGTTFATRDVRGGGDFGGNALVATAAGKQLELAAKFLDSMTEAQSQQQFCEKASLLPTRADLVESGISFAVRPELSPVFLGQAKQVLPEDSAQVASPSMSKIIAVLKEKLDGAFVGGADTDTTIAALSEGITTALSG